MYLIYILNLIYLDLNHKNNFSKQILIIYYLFIFIFYLLTNSQFKLILIETNILRV